MSETSATVERWAYRLGLGGLIPFVGLTLLVWIMPNALGGLAPEAQVLYAASILTFVGAVHWGVALTSDSQSAATVGPSMLWSVVPSLYCWLVALLPPVQALPLLAAGLLIAWLVDRAIYPRFGVPAWFMRLRTVLTGVAATSLVLTWVALLPA